MFILERDYKPDRTEGIFRIPNGNTVYSLERPWRDNLPYISCIPEGDYLVLRDRYGKHQWWSVKNVPNRTFIELHEATYVDQLEGCVSLGMERREDGALLRCKEALEKLLDFHGDDGFILRIKEKGK